MSNDQESATAPEPNSVSMPAPLEEKTYDISKGKADIGKRIIAALIDGVLVAIVSLIPVIGWVIGPLYWLLRDGLDIEFMNHRSIGKKLLKLRPITLEGKALTLEHSLKRNWPLALGGLGGIPVIGWFILLPLAMIIGLFEIILTLTDKNGRRFGDRFANTMVIESDD